MLRQGELPFIEALSSTDLSPFFDSFTQIAREFCGFSFRYRFDYWRLRSEVQRPEREQVIQLSG
jgi:hypothetical protein